VKDGSNDERAEGWPLTILSKNSLRGSADGQLLAPSSQLVE
jgi:hypothetical protein